MTIHSYIHSCSYASQLIENGLVERDLIQASQLTLKIPHGYGRVMIYLPGVDGGRRMGIDRRHRFSVEEIVSGQETCPLSFSASTENRASAFAP